MSKYSSMTYGTTGFQEIFVGFSNTLLNDLKKLMFKHIYLLGYF